MANGEAPLAHDNAGAAAEDVSVDLAEHHEALIGDKFRNPKNVTKQPTLATLGEMPFAHEDGDEVEHHRIVATEIVKDPVNFEVPEQILQNALVLLDPKISDCTHLIEAGKTRGPMIMAVVPKSNDGLNALVEFHPTPEALLEVGMHQVRFDITTFGSKAAGYGAKVVGDLILPSVAYLSSFAAQVYEPPFGSKFDVIECASHLKTIESQQNLRFLGVIPCREAAVDYADILGALLGLGVANDLGLASARRDKGLMKLAVSNAGLRVAKYARLTQGNGSDVVSAVKELELEYPVVVKTPRGMSTMDVFICGTEAEAVDSATKIVRSVGPDGRKVQYALLEEFIGGEEFALNLVASPTTPRGVQVTDIWMYHKINTDG
ncbi:hypothetical protein ACHAWF_000751, partial [Thalassiosira exigua]